METDRIAAWKKVEWVMPDQTPRTGGEPVIILFFVVIAEEWED